MKISFDTIEDPLTKTQQGTIFTFILELNGLERRIVFNILSNGMPVNFQYYGVSRETMDQVMSEYLSLVTTVAASKESALPPKVIALDHDIDTTGNLII